MANLLALTSNPTWGLKLEDLYLFSQIPLASPHPLSYHILCLAKVDILSKAALSLYHSSLPLLLVSLFYLCSYSSALRPIRPLLALAFLGGIYWSLVEFKSPWLWDPIELLSLSFLVIYLADLHLGSRSSNRSQSYILLISLLLIAMGNSLHSFDFRLEKTMSSPRKSLKALLMPPLINNNYMQPTAATGKQHPKAKNSLGFGQTNIIAAHLPILAGI